MAQVLEGGRSLVLWVLASGRAPQVGRTGWLVGWLVGWQVGLIGWLAGRSVGRSVDGLLGVVSLLVDCVQQAVVQASALPRAECLKHVLV